MMSPSVQEYAQKRMLSLNRLVQGESIVCDVRLMKVTKHHRIVDNMYRAEVLLTVDRDDFFAFSEKADLYQAVDDVRDELERLLSSHKQKRMVLFRKGAARIKEMIKDIRIRPYFRRDKKK